MDSVSSGAWNSMYGLPERRAATGGAIARVPGQGDRPPVNHFEASNDWRSKQQGMSRL
jgi:hypothetical protein